MFGLFDDRRRKKLYERPLPDPWRALLDEHFSGLDALDDDERAGFERHLKVFLWDKEWFGAGGLELTDEMRVVIAAAGALLARRLPVEVYDRVREIVVYPRAFVPPHTDGALGMAHDFGTLVFSWDDVARGIEIPNDGRNTAIHEFAHMLDLQSGDFNGAPVLHDRDDYQQWSRVLSKHFEALRDNPTRHEILDAYGATNEAEFFAVATEAFFEQPELLERKAPDLYEQLQRYYRIDPLRHSPTILG